MAHFGFNCLLADVCVRMRTCKQLYPTPRAAYRQSGLGME